MPFADILEFCRILSQKNGVTVRLPTDAEWEYAARVGTSNPCFTEKYKDQISETGGRPNTTPVQSKKPNAWGLYDMLCGGWHVTGDYKSDNVRVKEVDPDRARPRPTNTFMATRPVACTKPAEARITITSARTCTVPQRRNGTIWEGGSADLPGRRRAQNHESD